MKMKMTTRSAATVTAVAVALGAAGTARGGLRNDPPPQNAVWVDPQGRSFTGYLGSARDSADGSQYIGCVVTGVPAGSVGLLEEVSCGASDAQGLTAGCRSSDPTLIEVVNALNGDSRLTVSANLVNNTWVCTQFIIDTFSSTPPKQP